MELPFDYWLTGNGSSPWSITFPQYMRLSQEPPRKSPKTKPLKIAIRVTKLARSRTSQSPTQGPRRCHLQRKRRVKGRMGNHRKTMRVLCVVHAAKVMMISGSAVTCARNGSMASAWRSPQPKRNTSSSTSAPPAQAARGPRFESRKPEWPTIDSQVRAAIDSNTLSAYCRRWCLRIHLNLVSVLWLLTDCCSVCGLKHLCSVVYWIVCFRFQLCHVWSFSRFKVRSLPFPDWVRSSGTQRNLSEKVRPNWCPAMHDLVLWKCWWHTCSRNCSASACSLRLYVLSCMFETTFSHLLLRFDVC